jgi:hypothetical protein
MQTRGNRPTDDKACRCCRHAYENIEHFAECQKAGRIWSLLAQMAKKCDGALTIHVDGAQATPQSRKKFGLFALTGNNKPLEEGWVNFHLLLWKYFIYQVTIVDTEEATYEEHGVWKAALQRFEFKAKAKSEAVKTDMLRADSRGLDPPDPQKRARCLRPLANFDKDGALVWNNPVIEWIKLYMYTTRG